MVSLPKNLPSIGSITKSDIAFGGVGYVGTLTAAGAFYDVAATNADQEYNSRGTSAAMGAAAGIGSLGVGAAVAGTGYLLAKDNFKHSKTLAKGAGKILEATGNITMGVAEGTIKAGAGLTVGLGDAIDRNFFEMNPEKHKNIFNGLGLNKKGKIAAGLIGLGLILNDGRKTYDESRMGTPTGMVTSTPTIDYMGPEQYGAGGDLVFAMNQNRRG